MGCVRWSVCVHRPRADAPGGWQSGPRAAEETGTETGVRAKVTPLLSTQRSSKSPLHPPPIPRAGGHVSMGRWRVLVAGLPPLVPRSSLSGLGTVFSPIQWDSSEGNMGKPR